MDLSILFVIFLIAIAQAMKPLQLLPFIVLFAGLIHIASAQYVNDESSIVDVRLIVDEVDNFSRQLKFFRINYDDFSVEQSLAINAELLALGRQVKALTAEGLKAGGILNKKEKSVVKKVGKQVEKINNSLDRLGQFVASQDYKRRVQQPGGHSPIETEYFVKISNSIKSINEAKKILP